MHFEEGRSRLTEVKRQGCVGEASSMCSQSKDGKGGGGFRMTWQSSDDDDDDDGSSASESQQTQRPLRGCLALG